MSKKFSLYIPGKFRIKIDIESEEDYSLSKRTRELLRKKDPEEVYENNTIVIDAQFVDELLKEL
jgi:hypothetical protein